MKVQQKTLDTTALIVGAAIGAVMWFAQGCTGPLGTVALTTEQHKIYWDAQRALHDREIEQHTQLDRAALEKQLRKY